MKVYEGKFVEIVELFHTIDKRNILSGHSWTEPAEKPYAYELRSRENAERYLVLPEVISIRLKKEELIRRGDDADAFVAKYGLRRSVDINLVSDFIKEHGIVVYPPDSPNLGIKAKEHTGCKLNFVRLSGANGNVIGYHRAMADITLCDEFVLFDDDGKKHIFKMPGGSL